MRRIVIGRLQYLQRRPYDSAMKPSPDQIGLSPIPRSIFGRPEMVAGDQRVITMTISGRPEMAYSAGP